MTTYPSILLIDDSPGERELFRLALAQTGLSVALHTEQDAESAFRFLECQWIAPAVVPLRASNEALPRARVARAQDHASVVQSEPSASTETLPPAASSLPSLILLDLHLGRQNGCDLLKRLRSDVRFATIPVVVLTTSGDPTDLAHSYSCGASGYVVKPGTFDELVHCAADLCRYWLTWNRSLMGETRC